MCHRLFCSAALRKEKKSQNGRLVVVSVRPRPSSTKRQWKTTICVHQTYPAGKTPIVWLLTSLPLPACPDSSTTPTTLVLSPVYTTGVFCYRIEKKGKTFICCFWIIHQAWHALFLCLVGLLINMYRASLASFAACCRESIQNAIVIVTGVKVTINAVFITFRGGKIFSPKAISSRSQCSRQKWQRRTQPGISN